MSTRAEPPSVSAPGARAARAGAPNVVPVSRELLADLETPISAYLRLRDLPSSFLLESVEGPEQVARFSVLGGDPRLVLECDGAEVRVLRPDGTLLERGRPLETLERYLARYRAAPGSGAPALHRRLPRLSRVRRGAPVGAAPRPAARRSRPSRLPPGAHGHHRRVRPSTPHDAHRRERLPRRGRGRRGGRSAGARADRPGTRSAPKSPAARAGGGGNDAGAPVDTDAYCAAVVRAQEYIAAGDIFQVVLSQRFATPVPGRPLAHLPRAAPREPVAVHVPPRLRRRRQLVGSSPELARPARRRPGRDAAPRRDAPARRDAGRGRGARRRSCSPTRRSAPST